MGNRVAAIVAGIAIMFALDRWGGFHWYSALVVGAVSYGVVRYVGYFMRERRYVRDALAGTKPR
jgi:hypothetical protein